MRVEFRRAQVSSDCGLLMMRMHDDALGLVVWSLTNLQLQLIKIGARWYAPSSPLSTVCEHHRYVHHHAKTERKRQDRSERCAEKHSHRARAPRLAGLIHPVPASCAAADAGGGRKTLPNRQIQAIFKSVGTSFEECRINDGRGVN
jgi:hypothetical protein